MIERREAENSPPGTQWWRPLLLLAAVTVVIVLAGILDIGAHLGRLRGWIQSMGAAGSVVFVAIYAAATVAALPGSVLTVAAGVMFGMVRGTIVVSAGSTLGAGLSFLAGRYFARRAIARWLGGNRLFQRLEHLTERHGAVIVAITRLVPLFPFNLLNYGFGLTSVRFSTYLFWSWLCMLPATVMYVAGAETVAAGLRDGGVSCGMVAVAAGAVVTVVLLGWTARRVLKRWETSGGRENE